MLATSRATNTHLHSTSLNGVCCSCTFHSTLANSSISLDTCILVILLLITHLILLTLLDIANPKIMHFHVEDARIKYCLVPMIEPQDKAQCTHNQATPLSFAQCDPPQAAE